MTLRISVRDYRGIERADVELAPICLAAGMNEQGKSCLAQAARAALAGVAIPIPGIAKKDAKLLVRDGAERGTVSAALDGKEARAIEWPKCDIGTTEGGIYASQFAVGLRHLFDLDDMERASVLAGYINSVPDVSDLAGALADIGYGEKAVDGLWKSVAGPDGWDGTYKKAREHSTKLKGQWEGVTGEKYGSKKGETWAPEGWGDDPDGLAGHVSREDLVATVDQKETELERTIGRRAVADANLDALREEAKRVPELEKQEAKAREEKTQLFEAHRALQVKTLGPVPQPPMACPKCSAALALDKDGTALIEATDVTTAKQVTAAKKARTDHAQAVEKARAEFDVAYAEHQKIHAQLVDARKAAIQVDKLSQHGEGSATDADVEAARERLAQAEQSLKSFDAKAQADKLHSDVVRNDKLAAILAPDGLRRRKLAAGLEEFNANLAELSAAAKWPTVRIDENLAAHYGTRPVWAASASGQWRARVVAQVAMAKMDGSAAVVIDEADILDAKGRNGLVSMLKTSEVKALVCMTANRPDLVPDLAAAGLGRSYWLAAGVVQAIEEAKQAA